MKITLYTYQSKEAYEKLLKEGVLRLKEEDRRLTHLSWYDGEGHDYNHFEFPYRFVMHVMKERLPSPKYNDTYYPIWAWYKSSGRFKPSKQLDKIHEGNVRLKIEIDDSRVLLSDFDYFSAIIAGSRTFYGEDHDDSDEITPYNFDSFFHPTLYELFHLHRKEDGYYGPSWRSETIQATFWELYLDDVKEVLLPEDMKF